MSIWVKILKFLKKVVSILSEFAQVFSRTRPVYKLNPKLNRVELTDEVIDIQEEINSEYDELLFTRLEKYFDENVDVLPVDSSAEVIDELDDAFGGLSGSKADRLLSAFERVATLRARYGLSDLVTNEEVIAYVRAKASNQSVGDQSVGDQSVGDQSVGDQSIGGEDDAKN